MSVFLEEIKEGIPHALGGPLRHGDSDFRSVLGGVGLGCDGGQGLGRAMLGLGEEADEGYLADGGVWCSRRVAEA